MRLHGFVSSGSRGQKAAPRLRLDVSVEPAQQHAPHAHNQSSHAATVAHWRLHPTDQGRAGGSQQAQSPGAFTDPGLLHQEAAGPNTSCPCHDMLQQWQKHRRRREDDVCAHARKRHRSCSETGQPQPDTGQQTRITRKDLCGPTGSSALCWLQLLTTAVGGVAVDAAHSSE